MKGLGSKITKPIQIGTILNVVDNSGAKLIKVIGVIGYKGVKKRRASAGIADIVIATVKKGKPGMKKQIVMATIVRQKKEFRRPSGIRVKFEDNAAIILTNKSGAPKGNRIKGPIAREVVERFPPIGKIASMVV